MTDSSARLFLRKFYVFVNGMQIYSEEFHGGLNIIRGDHAVGKSTLLDLIFYSLGGELRKEQWVYPADQCTTVCVEAELNGRLFCFKRDIEVGAIPPIEVFDGAFAEGVQSLTGWQHFGARRSDKKSSFSQLVFELFGWGGYKTDDYANLTMHQILRLLYVDQETPASKIFRAEPQNSDNESTRLAIADFLLSLDDLELHCARQELLAVNKAFDKAHAELNAIYEVLGKDSEYSEENLQDEITTVLSEIQRLDHERRTVETLTADTRDAEIGVDLGPKFAELSVEIELITSKISETNQRLTALMGEITDCMSFKESLGKRKKALLESKATFETLGAVTFKHCPCCNSKVVDQADANICPLCKEEYQVGDNASSPYVQILTELEFQERQNEKAINDLKIELGRDRVTQQTATQTLNAKKALLRTIAGALSKREQMLIEVSRQMGFAESQVEMLREKIEIVQKVDSLREQKRSLNEQIGMLNDLLARLAAAGAARREQVLNSIAKQALEILEQDDEYEEVFCKATEKEAEIDFAKDRWLVDGRSKFSASSNVFKKNALHAAILSYAISDHQCRHPRFLILDDIENGGMTKPRSQNFQRILASLLNGKENDCQVIISTAMIDSSLDNKKYGLGPSYKKGEYVIQLP